MKSKIALLLLVAFFTIATGCMRPEQGTNPGTQPTPTRPVCVDFEPPLVVGTQYGSGSPVPGHNPGDVVFTTHRVPVSVHQQLSGVFNVATIVMPPYPFGSNQVINTNNINLGFDFRNIGFLPSVVTFEFLSLGGIQNLSVNGSPIFSGKLSSAPSSISGVTISVSMTRLPGNVDGSTGRVHLTGQVKELKIGGQEFWIDNVCAGR